MSPARPPEPGGTHHHAGRLAPAAGGVDGLAGGARGPGSDPRAGSMRKSCLTCTVAARALLTSPSPRTLADGKRSYSPGPVRARHGWPIGDVTSGLLPLRSRRGGGHAHARTEG